MPFPFRLRTRRDLRLASGLVLFAYLTLHLASHALGLASLDTAETALRATVVFWHSWPGTTLLYGAAAVHISLALLAVYERRTLRMPPMQALRIVLGLTMPIVLIGHFVGTRYAFEHFGLAADYQRVVSSLWESNYQGRQLALLVPGWLHGCLGLHYAFGRRRTWQRLRFALFGAALLLPVLAALGFLTMGRELTRPGASDSIASTSVTDPQREALSGMRDEALQVYLGLIALVAAARLVRRLDERRRKTALRITYPDRVAVVPRGWTVLEASRSFDIPHESMCGGRARCTTCRVRVTGGLAHCPPPGVDEQRALDRIDADPSIRLACQLRPTGDVAVQPLLAVPQPWWRGAPASRPTIEREVALLLCSFRPRGTGADAQGSAHDAIYALDRFHRIVGKSIASTGGVRCGQHGDRWISLFGLEGRPLALACSQALDAASQIDTATQQLVARLARELGMSAELSIVVHAGRVVVGSLGASEEQTLSAVGAAVRAAESLDDQARRQGWRFVLSQAAANAAAVDVPAVEWRHRGDGSQSAADVPFTVLANARMLPMAGSDPVPAT